VHLVVLAASGVGTKLIDAHASGAREGLHEKVLEICHIGT
jgi:hypothetical protein